METPPEITRLCARAEQDPRSLSPTDWAALLHPGDPDSLAGLTAAAARVKHRETGSIIRPRGLVEFSNQCVKNCHYCGIRRDNRDVDRYAMEVDEIVACAVAAHTAGFGSLVLQAGERRSRGFTDFVTETLERLHAATGNELGVTLSLGEQSAATYRRWREAGAHRYLLRIETTNRDLYADLHPTSHDWDERLSCLERLRSEDYQVGTGVLIGLPGQTAEDLAADLLFFRDQDVDMIGMGPFIPHEGTPLAEEAASYDPVRQLELGLRMISCARLMLRDVNIAATTALEALASDGRVRGLMAGANVVMPNLTPARYRPGYQLYMGKPALDENGEDSREKLVEMATGLGEVLGFGERGDAPHYHRRINR